MVPSIPAPVSFAEEKSSVAVKVKFRLNSVS